MPTHVLKKIASYTLMVLGLCQKRTKLLVNLSGMGYLLLICILVLADIQLLFVLIIKRHSTPLARMQNECIDM